MSKIVMVSGGFSILHRGHVRLVVAAAEYGRVIVALNSDAWLRRKHPGLTFPEWYHRAELLMFMVGVHQVVRVIDDDGTVCEALRRVKPDYFANGGDRTTGKPEEHAVCQELGIEELFGVGGCKVESSSHIAQALKAVT